MNVHRQSESQATSCSSLVFGLLGAAGLLPPVDGALLGLNPLVARVEAQDEEAGEEGEDSGEQQQRHWRRRGRKATWTNTLNTFLNPIVCILVG